MVETPANQQYDPTQITNEKTQRIKNLQKVTLAFYVFADCSHLAKILFSILAQIQIQINKGQLFQGCGRKPISPKHQILPAEKSSVVPSFSRKKLHKIWPVDRRDILMKLKRSSCSKDDSKLVGGWTDPFEKYAQVKLDRFPKFRGENKKYLSCHHLVFHP